MKRYCLFFITILLITILVSHSIFSDEGMWLLTQLDRLPWAKMQQYGLQLTPEQIYHSTEASLKDAIVLLGGGTGSFISPEGLILTNHHVAFGAIQSVSSVQADYLKDGFLASSREEEISIPAYTAQIVVDIKDVTSEVLSSVNDTMSAETRSKTIQARIREVEKSYKGDTDYECRIAETYFGVKYFLYKYEVLRDVRLVYAPPTSIGNYGGEIDNWMWPRHTGDFALMRAYCSPDGKGVKYSKDNVPYKPKKFLPISKDGYSEGSFAMIMGFPGRTFRYRTTPEIQLSRDEILPLTMELFKKRMDIMESAGKKDRAIELKFSNRWRGLANTYKNYQGTLEGMRRADIMKLRAEEEAKFLSFIRSKPELASKYGRILDEIAEAYSELKLFNKKQITLGQINTGVDMLRIAHRFKDYANSFVKDDRGKLKPKEGSDVELQNFIKETFKNIDISVDKQILTALLLSAVELPSDQQIEVIKEIVGKKTGEKRTKAIIEFVDDLYDDSKLTTVEGCLKLLEKKPDVILDDEFVEFAVELDKDFVPIQEKANKFNAVITQLRGKLLEAIIAWKGDGIYPDANRTLRLTYGTVKPYRPRDAVYYHYVTTLGGVIEKETGEDPFIVPEKLRELWEKKDFGPYADKNLGDVPVAFLANLDITGGNSGSPVINGRGELIGLAFDGNWEAVVGDYVYQEPLNRAISVDVRYILFILDKFSNAQSIMKELVIQ